MNSPLLFQTDHVCMFSHYIMGCVTCVNNNVNTTFLTFFLLTFLFFFSFMSFFRLISTLHFSFIYLIFLLHGTDIRKTLTSTAWYLLTFPLYHIQKSSLLLSS